MAPEPQVGDVWLRFCGYQWVELKIPEELLKRWTLLEKKTYFVCRFSFVCVCWNSYNIQRLGLLCKHMIDWCLLYQKCISTKPPQNLLLSVNTGSLWFSGCWCFAAAAAAAAFTACSPPCRSWNPPHKLVVSRSAQWPPGQEASGAGPHGSNARTLQLHAGEVELPGSKSLLCFAFRCAEPFCCQDSMLEYDGQPIDPAIVSAQPMKPAQNMEAPQMVCPPGKFQQTDKTSSNSLFRIHRSIVSVHPESRLSQSNSVPVQPEPTQVSGFIGSVNSFQLFQCKNILFLITGAHRLSNPPTHVSELTRARASTLTRVYGPHPGKPDWRNLRKLMNPFLSVSEVNINACAPSTDFHVVVDRAASPLYSSPPCLPDAGLPACFQTSTQQRHQCQRSSIPVHANSKTDGAHFLLLRGSLIWSVKADLIGSGGLLQRYLCFCLQQTLICF